MDHGSRREGWANNVQYPMQFVIHNVTGGSKVNGIDDLVVAIFLVAIEILRLSTVT